jgi:hypothetical protein
VSYSKPKRLAEGRRANLAAMRRMRGLPRWVELSIAVTLLMVAIVAAVFVYAGKKESNQFTRLKGLHTKGDVRAVIGPPNAVEVLTRAECWSYGPRNGITEAKLCFGERGRLAWFAYSGRS